MLEHAPRVPRRLMFFPLSWSKGGLIHVGSPIFAMR
jgi:hypothetical protein